MKSFLLIVVAAIYALYLEIYKNRIWGFVTAIIIFAAFVFVRIKFINEHKLYVRITSVLVLALLLVINAIISKPGEQTIVAGNGDKNGYTEVVSISQGDLKGVNNESGTVEIFAGIPYAKPPVGDLRWREPVEPDGWEGIKVFDTYAPMAMQKRSNAIYSFGSRIIGYHEIPISLHDNFLEARSEDCLYLNIWRPADAKEGDSLPVLFYIHGGSLNSGQTYFEAYNGESLASRGMIVVNFAYRLGVFGYLADDELAAESPNGTTGNYGLLDQIAALKWVNDNIEAFGGDPGNITIAGESAGASSVGAVCVSPLAKGLFRRAIAESSGITPKKPYHTFRTMDQAKNIASKIKTEFSCSSIEELRNIPADVLVDTVYQNNEMTVDGYAITEDPYLTYLSGNNNEESVLGGYNGTEAYVFLMFDEKPGVDTYEEFIGKVSGKYAHELATVLPAATDKEARDNFVDIVGMAWFGYSHYTWSELMAAQGKPAYLYYFTKDNKALGDWHAGELPYFYGNIKHNSAYNESDFKISDTIQGYIANYVKTGNPNGDGLPEWETYNSSPDRVLHIDETVQMEANTYLDVFKVFDKYMDEQ